MTQVALANVEYVYSTATITTAGASDTTSFGYGSGGRQFNSIDSTTINSGSRTSYRVRFINPILVTDVISIEYSANSGVTWTKDIEELASGIFIANGTVYGCYIKLQVNSTDIDIGFGNGGRRPGATYGGVGNGPWSDLNTTSFKWRVRKSAS